MKMNWILMASLAVMPLFSMQPREKWVVHEDQRDRWEEVVQRAGITTDYVKAVLQKYHYADLEFGKLTTVTPVKPTEPVQHVKEELIWQGDELSVFAARNPRVRHHIWVVLNRPVAEFSEVTDAEALKLRETVNKVVQVLRERCGIPYTVVAQSNRIDQNRFKIEVIPPRFENRDVHNALDKAESINYVIYNNRFPNSLPLPTQDEREQDLKLWQKAFTDGFVPSLREKDKPVDSWTQVQTDVTKAYDEIVEWFHQALVDEGIQIERIIQNEEIVGPDRVEAKMGRCSFCNDKVMTSQRVYQGEYCDIIYNYKPAALARSFLIVPKRHVRFSDSLNSNEIAEMHRLSVKLAKILGAEVNMYIQDGPSVGQTVLHTHMHVSTRPNPLRHILYSLNYKDEKCYSREEMEPYIKDIIEALQLK